MQKGNFISFIKRKLHILRQKFNDDLELLNIITRTYKSTSDQVLCHTLCMENLKGYYNIIFGDTGGQILLAITVKKNNLLFIWKRNSVFYLKKNLN